jgi:amino-acid N-acetyltransferase
VAPTAVPDSKPQAPRLRPATESDLGELRRLLKDLELPTAGVNEWWSLFTVVDSGDGIIGAAGVEQYADGALLRSVAVHPAWRSSGLGRMLVDAALDTARRAGSRDVYLLTTTAEHYFPRLGFTPIPRGSVPASVQASVEFREACPAGAVAMHRRLHDG